MHLHSSDAAFHEGRPTQHESVKVPGQWKGGKDAGFEPKAVSARQVGERESGGFRTLQRMTTDDHPFVRLSWSRSCRKPITWLVPQRGAQQV